MLATNVTEALKAGEVDNDEEHRELLHNLSRLKYSNDDVWYDVHPIVQPLLEA